MRKPFVIVSIAVLATIFLSPVSNAQTIQWDDGGAPDTEWNNGLNWDKADGNPPFGGEDAEIGSGYNATISSYDFNPGVDNLTIGGVLTITDGSLGIGFDATVDGSLIISGGSDFNVSNGFLTVNGDLSIDGTIFGDRRHIFDSMSVLGAGTVTFADSDVYTMEALVLDGATASVTQGDGSIVSIPNLYVDAGSYNLDGTDALLDLRGGDIVVDSSANFTFINAILLDVGEFDAGGNPLEQSGGTLVVSGIEVTDRRDTDSMVVYGDYSNIGGGTIAFDVQGDRAGRGFDVLEVEGNVNLDVDAVIDATLSGYNPAVGDQFDIIVADPGKTITVGGVFLDPGNLDLPILLSDLAVVSHMGSDGGGFLAKLQINSDGNQVLTLVYVPEPSTMLLAGVGMIGGVLALRRRRRLKKKSAA